MLGKGIFHDYDFILTEQLAYLENMKNLIGAADGQLLKIYKKFDNAVIDELIQFLTLRAMDNGRTYNYIDLSTAKSKNSKAILFNEESILVLT